MNYKDTEKLIKILGGVQSEMFRSVRTYSRDHDEDALMDSIDKQHKNLTQVIKVLEKQSKKDKF